MKQENLKPAIIVTSLVVLFAIGLWGYILYNEVVKHPVNVEYFKTGQILLPDYAITDTLIVMDAKGLNKEVALFEQGIKESTDGEIAATFYKYCTIK